MSARTVGRSIGSLYGWTDLACFPSIDRQLETATTNHAAGFAAIWSMLVLFAIIVGGTITMKRVRTWLID